MSDDWKQWVPKGPPTAEERYMMDVARHAVIGHCRDCKYWVGMSSPVTWGECLLPAIYTGDKPPVTCTGPLDTSPDFGCVAFVAKEQA